MSLGWKYTNQIEWPIWFGYILQQKHYKTAINQKCTKLLKQYNNT